MIVNKWSQSKSKLMQKTQQLPSVNSYPISPETKFQTLYRLVDGDAQKCQRREFGIIHTIITQFYRKNQRIGSCGRRTELRLRDHKSYSQHEQQQSDETNPPAPGRPIRRNHIWHRAFLPVEVHLGGVAVPRNDVDPGRLRLGERDDRLLLPGHSGIAVRVVAVHFPIEVVQPRSALHEDRVVPHRRPVEGIHLLVPRRGLVHSHGQEPVRELVLAPVEQRHPGAPSLVVVGQDVPVDAHAAVVAAGQRGRDVVVLDLRPGEGLGGPVVERHEEGLRREEQRRRGGVAGGAAGAGRAAAGAGLAGDDGVVVEGGERDAALGAGALGAGDVADHLPARERETVGIEAARVGEGGGADAVGLAALVVRVEGAGDVPVDRGKEDGAIEVGRHLVHLNLEGGDGLLRIHLRRQDGAVAATVRDAAEIGVVVPPRGEVDDGGIALAAEHLGEVQILVVLSLLAEDAVGNVDDGRVGALHRVDELVARPLPGELPAVEAAERVVVLDSYEGEVAAAVGLQDVVGDGEVAGEAREEASVVGFLGDVVRIGKAAGIHGIGIVVDGGPRAAVGGIVQGEELGEGHGGGRGAEKSTDKGDLGPDLGQVVGGLDGGLEIGVGVAGEGGGVRVEGGVVGEGGAIGEDAAANGDDELTVAERDEEGPGEEVGGAVVEDGGGGTEGVGLVRRVRGEGMDLLPFLKHVGEVDAVAEGIRRGRGNRGWGGGRCRRRRRRSSLRPRIVHGKQKHNQKNHKRRARTPIHLSAAVSLAITRTHTPTRATQLLCERGE
ncbi:hypothetical protein MUK42_24479 [Musa troglodytarum]|uniref:Uncharacterized protein n=1 Tax=Musa troglodytarum TaxID=320322 RepID=A0A9E7F2J8_9LILI|nr:hypothetical protein MUK42_24479 [Musa troglodytarum]